MCKVETDSAMGVKVLGLNVRIGGRDVMITIEEARLLEKNLREALHDPIDSDPKIDWKSLNGISDPKIDWKSLNEISDPKIDWKLLIV